MIIIILIIVCILLVAIGIYAYSTNDNEGVIVSDNNEVNVEVKSDSLPATARRNLKKPEFYLKTNSFTKGKIKPESLKTVIEMAIADGVLTIDDRELIKQTAINKGYDCLKVLDEVEKHVRYLEIDRKSKLVDLNEKNRLDFEKLIGYKFCIVLFKIKEWGGGEFSDNSHTPDLLVEFIGFEKSIDFAVKCTWQQRTIRNGIQFSTPEQLNRLRDYAKEKNTPVFIILGLGGKGDAPERLFIVPLKKISKPFLLLSQLNKYEKKVTANFYFDYMRKELK